MMRSLKNLIVVMIFIGFLSGCAGTVAEMPGVWIFAQESGETDSRITSLWYYIFNEDGSYEYEDMAIGYREHGTYAVGSSLLILNRDCGGTEKYELIGNGEMFRGMHGDEGLVFIQLDSHRMIASDNR